jgi:hypothetical protein
VLYHASSYNTGTVTTPTRGALGFTSSQAFDLYSVKQNQKLIYLNDNYHVDYFQKETKKLIEKFLIEIELTKKMQKDFRTMQAAPAEDPFRDRKYINCLAIATAAGIGAHIACAPLDVATAGLSALLCHGAATLLQVAMSDSCYVAWLEVGPKRD